MNMDTTATCISLQELSKYIAGKKEAIRLIDVRNKEEYEHLHMPFAINIPLNELSTSIQNFSQNDFIVTVCGKGGGRSEKAAEYLFQNGFKKVKWLCGGTKSWQDKAY